MSKKSSNFAAVFIIHEKAFVDACYKVSINEVPRYLLLLTPGCCGIQLPQNYYFYEKNIYSFGSSMCLPFFLQKSHGYD